nr:DUF5374 domain-containing protein [Aggregatibacter actinomycetemcomitans]
MIGCRNKRGLKFASVDVLNDINRSNNQWGNVQRKSAVEIYQRFQAIQIAENQHQRRFLGLPCESQVQQNQIRFQVICSQNQVSVKYPRGEISL